MIKKEYTDVSLGKWILLEANVRTVDVMWEAVSDLSKRSSKTYSESEIILEVNIEWHSANGGPTKMILSSVCRGSP